MVTLADNSSLRQSLLRWPSSFTGTRDMGATWSSDGTVSGLRIYALHKFGLGHSEV